jgi:uncharacterized membrane protein
MALFSNSKMPFLSQIERDEILDAIKVSEKPTSGEIRVFIESRCSMVNPLDRAEEIFLKLKMQNTVNSNAVLIYIAYKDHDFAVYGDRGCIIKFPRIFWKQQVRLLTYNFYNGKFKDGIVKCIQQVGGELTIHFPSNGENKNALPDEIVFGK